MPSSRNSQLIKVRELDRAGVNFDGPRADLPAQGFTSCSNVEFNEGALKRAPVFIPVGGELWESSAGDFAGLAPPVACEVNKRPDGSDDIFVANSRGKVGAYLYNSSWDVSPQSSIRGALGEANLLEDDGTTTTLVGVTEAAGGVLTRSAGGTSDGYKDFTLPSDAELQAFKFYARLSGRVTGGTGHKLELWETLDGGGGDNLIHSEEIPDAGLFDIDFVAPRSTAKSKPRWLRIVVGTAEGDSIEVRSAELRYDFRTTKAAITWPGGDVVTSAVVGECVYFAHPRGYLVGKDPDDQTFVEVNTNTKEPDDNGNPTNEDNKTLDPHPSFWRIVRPFGDRVMVFNHTYANGVNNSSRFRWSAPVLAGSRASDWNWNYQTSTAGQSEIPSAHGPILDAHALDNQMLVYSSNSIHRLTYIGGTFIFQVDPFVQDDGVLATNLVAPIGGIGHVVVGNKSIYLTDGRSKRNIAEGRVERWFRKYLDMDRYERSFTYVNRAKQEVIIAFPSLDPDASFQDTEYPNRGLVWNWAKDVWSVIDLQNTTFLSTIYFQDNIVTWNTLKLSGKLWSEFTDDDTWASFVGPGEYLTFTFSAPNDPEWSDAQFAVRRDFLPAIESGELTAASDRWTPPAFVENLGADFDAYGLPLESSKHLSKVTLQTLADSGENDVTIWVSHNPNTGWIPKGTQTFDNANSNYLTYKAIGRYLGYTITADGLNPLNLSGVDFAVSPISGR